MRRLIAVALLVVLGTLAACTGLPTTGPVTPGLAVDEVPDDPDFSFLPNGPQPGASPQEIVEGFIDAATSPADEWAIARSFLAPDIRESWQPEAGVLIDDPAERLYAGVDDDTVTLTLTAVADVDAAGAYGDTEVGPASLVYALAEQPSGEWRITQAPDGVVISEAFFEDVFQPYPVMYWDQSWTYLVPDLRWFPAYGNSATRVARALVDGEPSPWLAASVVSAFPEDVRLARPSVPVIDGVAQVDLDDEALGLDATTRGRMLSQLRESLQAADIVTVEMVVGGEPLTATAAPVRSTRVDARALVRTEASFGWLSGDEVEIIPGLSAAVSSVDADAVEISPDRDIAAVRLVDGSVTAIGVGGTFTPVDDRSGALAPTIDGYGFVWSVPATRPDDLIAVGLEGVTHEIDASFPEGSRITAMQLSRDGTRLAALTSAAGRHLVVVAGVIRDADGVPVALGEIQRAAALPGEGVDVAWLDDTSVGVLARDGEAMVMITQLIGGEGALADAPGGSTTLAGINQAASLRLLTQDGALSIRRGATWQQTAADILVLATQQGTPP